MLVDGLVQFVGEVLGGVAVVVGDVRVRGCGPRRRFCVVVWDVHQGAHRGSNALSGGCRPGFPTTTIAKLSAGAGAQLQRSRFDSADVG